MSGGGGVGFRPGFSFTTVLDQPELNQRDRGPFVTGHCDAEYGRSRRRSGSVFGRRSSRGSRRAGQRKGSRRATSATFAVSASTPSAVTIYGNYGVTKSDSLSVVPRVSIDEI